MCLRLPDRASLDDSDGTDFPRAIGEDDLGIEFGAPE
jgi:hypothetical protein